MKSAKLEKQAAIRSLNLEVTSSDEVEYQSDEQDEERCAGKRAQSPSGWVLVLSSEEYEGW